MTSQDGFTIIDGKAATADNGIEFVRNECSPFAKSLPSRPVAASESFLVDTYYGQAFDIGLVNKAEAVYGITESLPVYAIDELANAGFLRLPFRRVPRIHVRNGTELKSLLRSIGAGKPDSVLLFRGQTQEFTLERSDKGREKLYGNKNAIEPSLASSASRKAIDADACFVGWATVLQEFLERRSQAIRQWASEERLHSVEQDLASLRKSFRLSALTLALAQHYGLPTNGIDATRDLGVALFFAFTNFIQDGEGLLRAIRRGSDGPPSVLYLFYVEDRFQLDYERIAPAVFSSGRPVRQKARFLHTAWAYRANAVARNLFAAIYLDPRGDFGDLLRVNMLFPGPDDDDFGKFLSETKTKPLPTVLADYLRYFRWVA
ncbi:MAG: FRG domain-containing protein [Acidobacteria bacterium]|nr:FRG domain-containing protein [Acidobacteriota bacterium]